MLSNLEKVRTEKEINSEDLHLSDEKHIELANQLAIQKSFL